MRESRLPTTLDELRLVCIPSHILSCRRREMDAATWGLLIAGVLGLVGVAFAIVSRHAR